MNRVLCLTMLIVLLCLDNRSTWGQGMVDPPLPDGSADAQAKIAGMKIPLGAEVKLFAAEPMLHSPVALCLDEKGRVFVTEEYRFNRGTEENRTRPYLLDDDLQTRTLEDRAAVYQKFADKFEGGLSWLTKFTDRVVRLTDVDGDGVADQTSVFAAGLNGPLDGLASGVIARDGDVYVTCIPHLWRFRDRDGDGKAEEREQILTGFGVNNAFLGHDLHGLLWGTDGRLYFSIGDRGFHVRTKEGKILAEPRRGAVFRCKPDGSELEVVHRGLRNPQELAMDDHGNIFADDNNCDKGDHSRLVWVVEGGDCGWNMAFQSLAAPYLTGPWHAEKIWHLEAPEQPAWVTPPLGKLGAGPSGFVHDVGIGLPERYRNHFFMCNYTGNGGIESFAIQPMGASFEIVDAHDFLKPVSATDCDFGYDGRMYISDFVGLDWSGKTKGGRVYSLTFPELQTAPVVAEVTQLFREGLQKKSSAELVKLLAHPDQRVRLRSQFVLAERDDALNLLQDLSQTPGTDRLTKLARLHAIWGLGQMSERKEAALYSLPLLLADPENEVRTQVAKVLGNRRYTPAAEGLLKMLSDEDDRVKFHAIVALGQLQHINAVQPLLTLLKNNANRDRYLRHAAVFALARIGDEEALRPRIVDSDPAVRLAVLLVYRHWSDSTEVGWVGRNHGKYAAQLVSFLHDTEANIITEAARVINDFKIDSVNDRLAEVSELLIRASSPLPDALVRRVIHANYRLGRADNAVNISRIAMQGNLSLDVRREALSALRDWAKPSPRDRVTGNWRPLENRDVAVIKPALEAEVPRWLNRASPELQTDVTQVIQTLRLQANEEVFLAWLKDEQKAISVRVAALQYLATTSSEQVNSVIESSLQANQPELRATARDILARRDAARGLEILLPVLRDRDLSFRERQAAFHTLAVLKTDEADLELERWIDSLATRRIQDSFIELDVFEAATSRGTDALQKALKRFEDLRAPNNPWWRYEATLEGGDAERGRALFIGHAQAQCVRCHKINGQGGDVGPDLSRLGSKVDRRQFRQSLLEPDAMISPGFGIVTLQLDDGRVLSGTIKAETPESLELVTPDGRKHQIAQDTVERRSDPKSPMPPMSKVLSPRDVRDLVEFLAEQK